MSKTFEKGQHYMGLILCGAAVFAAGTFCRAVMVSIGIQLEKRRANETQNEK